MNWLKWIRLEAGEGVKEKKEDHLSHRQIGGLIVLLIILSLLLTILLSGYSLFPIPVYKVGDIARADIIVPAEVMIIDQEATNARKATAMVGVLPVFRFDPSVQDQSISRLSRVFAQGRSLLDRERTAKSVSSRRRSRLRFRKLPSDIQAEFRSAIRTLGINPPLDDLLDFLVKEEFNPKLEDRLVLLLRQNFATPILPEDRNILRGKSQINLLDPATGKNNFLSARQFLTIQQAREKLVQKLNEDTDVPPSWRPGMRRILENLLAPDLRFDLKTTQANQIRAAMAIDPIMRQLKKGKVILRRGDEVSPDDLVQIEAIRKFTPGGIPGEHFAAMSVLIAIFLIIYGLFLRFLHPSQWNYVRLACLSGLVLLANIIVLKVFGFIGQSLNHSLSSFPFNNKDYFFYLLPFAFGAMSITLLAGQPSALLFLIFYAPLAGKSVGMDFYVLSYILISNLVGILAVKQVRQRMEMIGSGFKLGLTAAVVFIILQWSNKTHLNLIDGLWGTGLAFLTGPVNAGLLVFSLPLFERLFMVATEIRLSELDEVNLPPLQQLISKAPGTYNHSIAVGVLCERAAKAVDVSPLFLRVAGLYHDIGKAALPEYFVENQRQENPHNQLTPQESIRILNQHVVEGIRMAREANLPPAIVELIPQHHGTKLMHYFYEKAKQNAASGEKIDQENFRYPGPKPQTKTAAILMLADGVEAAARTLTDHAPERLLNVIKKIISSTIEDGQLSECDITIAELDRITSSFLETLSSYYHNRVAYPGFDFKQEKPIKEPVSPLPK